MESELLLSTLQSIEKQIAEHLPAIRKLLEKDSNFSIVEKALSSVSTQGVSEFEELKKLFESTEWAQAVDPDLICDETSKDQKEIRAESIIDFMIDDGLEGKKFLDFGCGLGYCVLEGVRQNSTFSVGYDIEASEEWDSFNIPNEKGTFTTDWQKVKSLSPYDAILVYDVMDHLKGDPVTVLKQIKEACHSKTIVYIRCHPWTSRSATHLYRKTNKAYAHLVFSEEELAQLGVEKGMETTKIIHPHMTYKGWFEEAGFAVLQEDPLNEELEPFFMNNQLIADRIKRNWKDSHDTGLASGEDFPQHQTRIQFIDYLLRSI